MMLLRIVVMAQRHVFQEIWRTEYVSEMGHFCELESRSQSERENMPCYLGDILSKAYAINHRRINVDQING